MPLPVYLVHYRAEVWLRSAVASILRSDIPVDLAIVSNSGRILVDGARTIDVGTNLGYAGAANVAIRDWLAGREPFAVIGSHDLHLEPGALRALRQAMDGDPTIGMAAPFMPDAATGSQTADGYTWLSGQGLMFRRACIEEIGGFDERFGSYGEDRDLGLRAFDAGWRLGRVHEAVGHGLGSAVGVWRARRRIWPNRVALATKREGVSGGVRALIIHEKLAARSLRAAVRDRPNRREHLRQALERVRTTPACIDRIRRFRPGPAGPSVRRS